MNILLISQCSKRALTETRHILDQFAERRGDRTWQTPITLQGLDTLRKLLKKTARKNTAVACHWIRGLDHSELLWIVGDNSQFGETGAVPTNFTTKDVLRAHDENDWHTGEDIKLLARMAALWHDVGKANKAFQNKLKHPTKPIADAYRHEWVSLRLFEGFVKSFGDKANDNAWLQGLAQLIDTKSNMDWFNNPLMFTPDSFSGKQPLSPFSQLPPLAQAVGWLIVTHHRLPCPTSDNLTKVRTDSLISLPKQVNAAWCGARDDSDESAIKACWDIKEKDFAFASSSWRQKASYCAQQMLRRRALLTEKWLGNPYALHIARLVLMLADHHYSSLPTNSKWGDKNFKAYANTDKNGDLKQPLDNHLLGVEDHARRIMGNLPRLTRDLPRLARHKGFRRRAKDARFRWQDKAFDIAESLQERSQQQGFFGVNMASTGCGKTLANGRIMYALAHPKLGARFSIALGLRTLTLQTGQAYRQHLGLGDDDLAVLVGGAAVRELFENQQQNAKKSEAEQESPQAKLGSESAEALIPDNSYVSYEGSLPEGSFSEWLSKNPAAQKLLSAPVLTCTIDHLMPATESTRGGHQIAPMLRLMTSDLVLDEPDDFDLDDLPALSRLVYWAGMLGSRVLLSSATLPPALIQGLFQAYQQGRTVYQKNRGIPNSATTICCSWFDEFNSQCSDHDDSNEYLSFKQAHNDFVQKRLAKLLTADQRRVAVIQDVAIQKNDDNLIELWAKHLLKLSQELHLLNHNPDPKTGKNVSFGLIRMANIDPLIDVAQALLTMIIPTNTHIHLCVYHSRHPLVIRSHIEATLDNALNRQKSDAVFNVASVRQCLDKYSEQNHLFIVLASPVAEVGRDHDYDWAIVEPSSMRSIIQLAGRIRRHRFGAYNKANIYLLNSNIKSLKNSANQPCFLKPGFESGDYLLHHHELRQLLAKEDFQPLTSAPRITERNTPQPHDNLVDLEHARLKALMLAQGESHTWPVPTWWRTPVSLSGVMQQKQRFRKGQPEQLFGLITNDDGDDWSFKAYSPTVSPNPWQDNNQLVDRIKLQPTEGISFWLDDDYLTRLDDLAKDLDMPLQDCAYRFGVISLPESTQGWFYHVGLGFRRKK